MPSDGAPNSRFGGYVAISGGTAIVGAEGDAENGSRSGSAYLFDVTTGDQIAKLLASDGAAGDHFGRFVGISGGTAIVGASLDDDFGSRSGSAYLFDVATGVQIAKLLPNDGAAFDQFGHSAGISGDLAIVGARFDDDKGQQSGSAYLFDATTGVQIAKLLASDGAADDAFGIGVAIDGGTVIIGAYADADNGFSSGSAYLFGVNCVTNEPPVAVCGNDITVDAQDSNGAIVQLNGAGSSDPDADALTFHWDVSDQSVVLDDPNIVGPVGLFLVGVTMATLTVTDPSDAWDTCDVLVTVQDATPPEVMCTTDVAALWPPDHGMRTIEVYVMGTDNISNPQDITPTLVAVSSDEPDDADGTGDGETTGDVNGADGYISLVNVTAAFAFDANVGDHGAWVATIQLRAEREGAGDGRCYTIEVLAVDTSGNEAASSCCVVVPHDRRRRR